MSKAKDLSTYIRQFTKLRRGQSSVWTADTQYRAPHKPFLLLTILDLFAQGRIQSNLIEISAELGESFAGYWRIVIPHRRGNIALPFFHLRSSPFWHLIPNPGQEQALGLIRQVDTLNQLNHLVLKVRDISFGKNNWVHLLMYANDCSSSCHVLQASFFFSADWRRLVDKFQVSRHPRASGLAKVTGVPRPLGYGRIRVTAGGGASGRQIFGGRPALRHGQ